MKQSTLLAIVLAVQSSHAQDQVGDPKNLDAAALGVRACLIP